MQSVESKVYNLASESQETRRIPDPFPYYFNSEGKLVLGYTGEIFEESIERNTYLGQAEFEGFQKLQKMLQENNSGRIAWLSPHYPGEYPEAKIVVYGVYGPNLGVSTTLDGLTPEDCLLYAQDLGSQANSLEEVRVNPILLEEKNWLNLLEKYKDVSRERHMITSGYYLSAKEEAIRQPVFGSMPLRCAPRGLTSFQAMFENAFYIGPTFDCPKCKEPIPSGKGITTCPHCGARKEDYGSTCD